MNNPTPFSSSLWKIGLMLAALWITAGSAMAQTLTTALVVPYSSGEVGHEECTDTSYWVWNDEFPGGGFWVWDQDCEWIHEYYWYVDAVQIYGTTSGCPIALTVTYSNSSQDVITDNGSGGNMIWFHYRTDSEPSVSSAVAVQDCCSSFSVSLSGSSVATIGCNYTYTASVSGGSGNYSYSWLGSTSSGPSSGGSSRTFGADTSGAQWVQVTVVDNVRGCSSTQRYDVAVHDTLELATAPSSYASGSTIIADSVYNPNTFPINPTSSVSNATAYQTGWTVSGSVTWTAIADKLGFTGGGSYTSQTTVTRTFTNTWSGSGITLQPGQTGVMYLTPRWNLDTGDYYQWGCSGVTSSGTYGRAHDEYPLWAPTVQ